MSKYLGWIQHSGLEIIFPENYYLLESQTACEKIRQCPLSLVWSIFYFLIKLSFCPIVLKSQNNIHMFVCAWVCVRERERFNILDTRKHLSVLREFSYYFFETFSSLLAFQVGWWSSYTCPCYCCCLVAQLCATLLRLCGLQLTRFLCPWDFPSKNIGVVCHFLLQGIFLAQGSNLCLLH